MGVDIAMLALLNVIFGGSILGVISATAGSTLISLYLIWYPIRALQGTPSQDSKEEASSKYDYEQMAKRFDSLFD